MPYFPGPWLPRRNDEQSYPLYCASMLALFKPWRSLLNLKPPHLTFTKVFLAFSKTASPQILKAIDNIQYFYECSDKARENHIGKEFGTAWSEASECHDEETDDADETADVSNSPPLHSNDTQVDITEEDIENAMKDNYPTRELLYADVAINIAEDFGIFNDIPMYTAPQDEVHIYTEWRDIALHSENAERVNPATEQLDTGSVHTASQGAVPIPASLPTVQMQPQQPEDQM
ncbi:uncharacterized protein EDB91DRAFT_1289639 [Suillus paluster]|uniref:uncharacterized protein n=1 Tax=Suillus paluster TaxID=48578 RepID=UPI001B866384|nr:uncharacterized protein EDB91DRAFT_1289639 [Suillus paluster]KAG1719366.1 hypothetical protein EDB91DRAFT_1289639 [Suillus paluster]